jgi:DNA-binding transcriptional ArsR family regulator
MRSAPRPAPDAQLLRCLGDVDDERRLLILDWLKNPARHFRPQVDGDLETDGICGALIAGKLGVSQPTVSEHTRVLVDSGPVRPTRIRQ